jgi:hypothetical protein
MKIEDTLMNDIVGLGVLLLLIGLYALPTLIAFKKHKRNAGGIYVVNMFLGWTLIGWVVALAWAACEDEHPYVPPPSATTDNNGMISLGLKVEGRE